MKNYFGVDLNVQREKLLKSTTAQRFIKDITEKADKALTKEYKALKMSDYMLFFETGDRNIFEREYFERRNDCSYISIAYWLTEDEKYKKTLIDLIFHICDEYTWCLPAHVPSERNLTVDFVIGEIDLFQAETARLLTDISVFLENRLPAYVNDRIEYEIRRRIIEPLKTRTFRWYKFTNNWAAVCAGGTGIAVLHYATTAEKEKILPLLDESMKRFLSGFNDDGCCLEGYDYWNYGFGYYLIYAVAMLEYSNGKINMFEDEKVKQIAFYPQRVRLGKAKNVSFSDGGSDFLYSPGAFSLLRKVYGTEFKYPPLEYATLRGNVYSVKEFLWFDTEYEEDEDIYTETYFEKSQWYIKRGKMYSVGVKGGHNNEPHNHNDIGSFMVVTQNDDIPLADLGAAIYRKETFSDKRYTLLNNSSRGHSVPVVNGEYQKEGESFKAKNAKAGKGFFEVDIEGAYEEGLIKRINRRFEFKEKSILLTDTFEYSDKTEEITERLITMTKPEICDGCVDLKTAKVLYDGKKYKVSVSQDSYRNHSDTEDVTVYFIDFIGSLKTKFEVEISF